MAGFTGEQRLLLLDAWVRSKLPEPTRRAILMMKHAHPDWGQDRIHDMLLRTDGLEASADAVQRALRAHGYLEFRRGRISTPVSTWMAGIRA